MNGDGDFEIKMAVFQRDLTEMKSELTDIKKQLESVSNKLDNFINKSYGDNAKMYEDFRNTYVTKTTLSWLGGALGLVLGLALTLIWYIHEW